MLLLYIWPCVESFLELKNIILSFAHKIKKTRAVKQDYIFNAFQLQELIFYNGKRVYSPSDWNDVVVVREGMLTTLICNDTSVRGPVTINWKVKLFCTNEWKLIMLASTNERISGSALKPSMQLTDSNFKDSGVFSLSLKPEAADIGFYSCLIQQKEKILKEEIILLVILTGRNNKTLLCI